MFNGPQFEGIHVYTVLIGVFTVVPTIFWMVVGWRAMRAHERIADKLDQR